MANNRDWNEIFLRDKVDDSTYCEINQNIYNEVTKDSYKNLDACVAHAIATGNHTAFVHFFMNKAKRQQEVFLSVFWKYIEEYENKLSENKKLPSCDQFQILRSSYWRSFAFDYIEQNVKKYCYKSMFSHWKSIAGAIPGRDVIVQCCFYFGKNAEQTNRLLLAAGHEQLYVLDIVDAIEIHYLDKYCGNFEIPAFEKLKEVKEKINIALERSCEERDDLVAIGKTQSVELKGEKELTGEEQELLQVLEPKWDRKKVSFRILKQKTDIDMAKVRNMLQETYGIEYYETCAREEKEDEERILYQNIKVYLLKTHQDFGNYLEWSSKTGSLYRFAKEPILKLGRTSAIGWDIDDEIEKYRNILEQEKENKKESGNTNYLTLLYTDKLLKETADINQFIESGKIGNSEGWIFAQKRYGYFLKTLQYVKEYDYYLKNLQYSPCNVGTQRYAVTLESLRKRGIFLDSVSAKFVKNIKQNKKYTKEKLNRTLPQLLNKIWEISDAINEKGYMGEYRTSDKRSGEYKVKNLIEGRNFLNRKDFEADFKSENKKNMKAFEQDLTEKIYVMKLAIAAGREDEIGTYLQLAGYWDKDFTMIKDAELKELVDRTDCLILYALKYRDALLEKWAYELNMDKLEYKNEARKEFPFLKLLMTINRDIQFVHKKIMENKTELDDLIYKNESL